MSIAAISTPIGTGGIGMIRISGTDSIKIAEKIFFPVNKERFMKKEGYCAHFGYIQENNEKIDEVILTVFKKPNSYTGEDVVEISCHGGLYITQKILDCVIKNGAKLAEPGEFTKKAFLNGKINLAEAESIIDIINAKTESAARAAISVKSGSISKKIFKIKENLLNIASHLSAFADFPEEDIPEIKEKELLQRLISIEEDLNNLLKNYDQGKFIKEGINTVIIGKPNVGKSSLMNVLSGYEKSIVTNIEGTTRDIVEEKIKLGDIILNISDTAGIRSTDNEIEKIGVEKAKELIKESDLILCIFDNSRSLTGEDNDILNSINQKICKIAIINKCDLDNNLDIDKIKEKFDEIVCISVKENNGIDKLKNLITKKFFKEEINVNDGILANERQKIAVEYALKSVEEAKLALQNSFTLDAVNIDIEETINYLMELTGENISEEIVNNIFHNFCVGK